MVKLSGGGPVIIVDDDTPSLRLAELVFEDSNVPNPVLLMSGGEELLAYLDKVATGSAEMPSIILIDINLGGWNGHDVVRYVRAKPEFKSTPSILMLSAAHNPNDLDLALKAGANAYQVKPFGLDEFLAFANALLPDAAG